MSFATVGQKLCYSQGIDPIRVFDPTNIWTPKIASLNIKTDVPDSPPAKYLFELGNHLMALNTLEQGTKCYQRVHWSGAGDPTDWTSFSSGQIDLFNDFGPVNGGVKLSPHGFIMQQLGIEQCELTGNAQSPFYFTPKSSKAKGLAFPRTLAANGEAECFYVGQDNVYLFDGTVSNPIGNYPLSGRIRGGARTKIFNDIKSTEGTYGSPGWINNIFGFFSISVNGNAFAAYWLVIPGVSIWIFSLDDWTWTRWTIDGVPTCIGNYLYRTVIRILDLVGIASGIPILSIDENGVPTYGTLPEGVFFDGTDQTNALGGKPWYPATLTNDTPFTNVILGFDAPKDDSGKIITPTSPSNGLTKMFDFSGWSEQPWSIKTGQMPFGDPRHSHIEKKMRLTYTDNMAAVPTPGKNVGIIIQVMFENEKGEQVKNNPQTPFGTQLNGYGNGKVRKQVIPVNLPGEYLEMTISGLPGVPFEMTSFSPMYSIGGETANTTPPTEP